MSKMKELYLRVSKDGALQGQFSAIMKDAEKAGENETTEKLIAFAKDAGYDVNVDEMQAFFKELAEQDKGELSEPELDMVAGGKGTGWKLASIGTLVYGCLLHSAAHDKRPETEACYE